MLSHMTYKVWKKVIFGTKRVKMEVICRIEAFAIAKLPQMVQASAAPFGNCRWMENAEA